MVALALWFPKVGSPDQCGAWSSPLLSLNLAPALTSYLPVLATGGGDNNTSGTTWYDASTHSLLPTRRCPFKEGSLNIHSKYTRVEDFISWRQREQSRFKTVRKYTCLVRPTACSPESSDGSLIFSASASPACHSAWLRQTLSLLFLPPLTLPDFLPSTAPICSHNSQSFCS